MGTSINIKSPRLWLILLGLVGYFLAALGWYIPFGMWVIGLTVISQRTRDDAFSQLTLGAAILNLIVLAIVLLGLDGNSRDGSFFDILKEDLIKNLILAGIVAVILFVMFYVVDGRSRDQQ